MTENDAPNEAIQAMSYESTISSNNQQEEQNEELEDDEIKGIGEEGENVIRSSSSSSNQQNPLSSPELLPSSSSLSNNQRNIIRRRRFALSCNNCRRRKVKCDRTVPCSQCRRRGEASTCAIEDIDRPYDRGYELPPSITRRHSSINVNSTSSYNVEERIRSIRRELEHLESLSSGSGGGIIGTGQDSSSGSSSRENISPLPRIPKSPFEEVSSFILDQKERSIVHEEDKAIDRLEGFAWTGESVQNDEKDKGKPVYWSEWSGLHTSFDNNESQMSFIDNRISNRSATPIQRKFQLLNLLPPPPVIEILIEIFQERVSLLTGNVVRLDLIQNQFREMCLNLQRDQNYTINIPSEFLGLLFSICLLAITYPPNDFTDKPERRIIQPYIQQRIAQDWTFAVQEALELQGGPLLLQSRQAIQASHLLDFYESNPEKRDARLHVELAAAQRIGLHRIQVKSDEQHQTQEQRIVEQYDRRLWWALVARDWGDSLGRQSFSVLQKMTNVPLPEEIEERSNEHIYLNANIDLASVVRDHCQAIMNATQQNEESGNSFKFSLTERKMLDLRYLGVLAKLSDSLDKQTNKRNQSILQMTSSTTSIEDNNKKIDELTFKLLIQQNVFQKRLLLHRNGLSLQSNLRFSQFELATKILKTFQEFKNQKTIIENSMINNNQAHLFLSSLISLVHLIVNHDLIRNGKQISIIIEREKVRSLANVAFIIPTVYSFSSIQNQQKDQVIFRMRNLLIGLLKLEEEMYETIIGIRSGIYDSNNQSQEDLSTLISRIIRKAETSSLEQQQQQEEISPMIRMQSNDSLDRIVSSVMTSLPSLIAPSEPGPMNVSTFSTNPMIPSLNQREGGNMRDWQSIVGQVGMPGNLYGLQNFPAWRPVETAQPQSEIQQQQQQQQQQSTIPSSQPTSTTVIDPRTASQAQFWDWLMSQNFS